MRKPKMTLMEAIDAGGPQALENVVRRGVFGRRKRMTKAKKREDAIDAAMLRVMADEEFREFWAWKKALFLKGRTDLAKANEEFDALTTKAIRIIAVAQLVNGMGGWRGFVKNFF